VALIDDELVGYTRSLVGKNNNLTYGFRKGEISKSFRNLATDLLNEIDDHIGLNFKRTKPSKADVIIGYGELPPGAAGAAVWTDIRWEIRLPESYFSTTIFRHEMGHVLGLNHVPMGSNSLMQPSWGGVGDFTKRDLNALTSIWSD
jgi:hypothetical protein